jgi:Lon protease-like protein
MPELPMFPLGSVLFPYMPIQLRVFEERYLVMLSRILESEPSEFGVVLIERGQEVGGGERRFPFGTVAQVTELEGAEGFVGVLAEGERRIEVVEWLDDDPHPVAVVRAVPDLVWDDALLPLRAKAEQIVRRSLALASEFRDQAWSATVELSDDPLAAAWQLAAIAPLSEFDQIELLRSTSMKALLESLAEFAAATEESLRSPWPDDDDDEFDAGSLGDA